MFIPNLVNKLNLSDSLSRELISIIEIIHDIKTDNFDFEAYLFGSFAKRNVATDSDIDILILLKSDNELDKKQLRDIRWNIEDEISYRFNNRDVDIKLYTKNNFIDISRSQLCFESIISDYMYQIK